MDKLILWDFNWDCFESIDKVDKTDISTILSLPIHEHEIFHHLFNSLILSAFYSVSHLDFCTFC